MDKADIIELNKNIGNRLKAVRHIYNEGMCLSVKQFAYLLDISTEKLLNYEKGRTALPIDVLLKLYNRGINPMFLITGENTIFTDTDAGQLLEKKIINKNPNYKLTMQEVLSKLHKKI